MSENDTAEMMYDEKRVARLKKCEVSNFAEIAGELGADAAWAEEYASTGFWEFGYSKPQPSEVDCELIKRVASVMPYLQYDYDHYAPDWHAARAVIACVREYDSRSEL